MKITLEKLNQVGACRNCYRLLKANFPDGGEFRDVVERAIAIGALDDALWLAPRVLTKEDAVRYAVFAAREVLPIFEDKNPHYNRPRAAIESAEAWLANPCDETSRAVDAAADAAFAAFAAASAADAAASAAAYAARAAEFAARAAEFAARAAADAAFAAAYSAFAAAYAARVAEFAARAAACTELKVKLLRYAVELADKVG